MKYAFVSAEGILKEFREFPGLPPTVAPSKGRWMGIVVEEKPSFDPETHVLQKAVEIAKDEYRITWQRFPIIPEGSL